MAEGGEKLCVDVCKTHHPKIIRFYCKNHDEPGCRDCMTISHTSCRKDRVQDISDGFEKTKEFKHIDQTLQQLHQELEEIEDVLDNNLKNVDTTYNNILSKITSVRKQINEYLDQIQKKISDKAAQMKKEDETELKTILEENQTLKAEIEVMLKTLHSSNVNVNSLFVITKLAKKKMVTMEKEIKKINQSRQQVYEFQISNEIEKIVSAKPPLGKLSRKSLQKVRTMAAIKAAYNRSIHTKGKECCISDSALLSPDILVFIDRKNYNVHLIDISNNKVISRCRTSSTPSGVTALSKDMIAVILPDECKLQLLHVTTIFDITTITLEREIKVHTICHGIAYKDGKLAISYIEPGRVEILTIKGSLLYKTIPNQGTECSLQRPEYITFGQDNNTVIVSDCRAHKVSVFTFSGQIMRTYTHETLKDPKGIVITADGFLFVCSLGSGCIHVVSPNFKRSKIIINEDNNVVHPRSITYCDKNHRLYISNTHFTIGDLQNKIQVYDLKVPV